MCRDLGAGLREVPPDANMLASLLLGSPFAHMFSSSFYLALTFVTPRTNFS